MFSKQLKITIVTFLLIVFCIVSISVLCSQAEPITGFKCDDYLTKVYTDANNNVIENGCADIAQAVCDTTDLTLTITQSTGCNTSATLYTCEETTETWDDGTVNCGWVKDKCRATAFSNQGGTFKACSDEYIGT